LNTEEGMNRYKIFKENLKWINENNTELGKEVYGITPFVDLTNQEFQDLYLIKSMSMEENIKNLNDNLDIIQNDPNVENEDLDELEIIKSFNTKKNLNEKKLSQESISNNIDWRPHMNPVKNQSSCGSCWAFASLAAVEGAYSSQFNTKLDLSEQYLVDCDTIDGSCNGGWPSNTYKWMMDNGIVNTSDYPYKAVQSLCKISEFKTMRKNLLTGYKMCFNVSKTRKCNTNNTWLEYLRKGPLVVVGDFSAFGFYKPKNEEPVIPKSCGKVNHAVAIVGYVIENGIEYLIGRNSWGVNWGFGGHFKIPASSHCGMLDLAWLPEIQSGEQPFKEPSCPTFYEECDFKGQSISTCDGISEFSAFKNKRASSFKIDNTNVKEHYFFSKPNCLGEMIHNKENVQCDTIHSKYKISSIQSAAPFKLNLRSNCIMHFSSTCLSGNQTLICNSIPDLNSVRFKFTRGSLYIDNFYIKHLIFFEEKEYKGKAFSLVNRTIYNSINMVYSATITKAQSVMIVLRDPKEPFDPDW